MASLQDELAKEGNVEKTPASRVGFNTTSSRSKRQAADKNKVDSIENDGYGGTTYIRWGRRGCREGADTLYSGGYSGHAGGGADYQCLPLEPQFGYVKPGTQYSVGIGGSSI
ncbi:Uncharacterised protein r2_g4322 [Pycnogonum litorale]